MRLFILAFVTFGLTCGGQGPFDGEPESLSGDIEGIVMVDGKGRSGSTIALEQGSPTIASTTTGSDGTYRFHDVPAGAKTLELTPVTGATCVTSQHVNVTSGGTARVDFSCTSRRTSTASVSGAVLVNGVGEPHVLVTLWKGATTIATITGADGRFSFRSVPVSLGGVLVSIATPSGATCSKSAQTIFVGEGFHANFACTRPTPFNVTLRNPAPGYCHIEPGERRISTGIETEPVQPGASYSVSWSGFGIEGVTALTGELDASGRAFLDLIVHRFGSYTADVSVTASGETVRAPLGRVFVDLPQGACQQP